MSRNNDADGYRRFTKTAPREEHEKKFLHNELADESRGFDGHLEKFMDEVLARSTDEAVKKPLQLQWDRLFGRLETRIKHQQEHGNQRELHPNWLETELNDPKAELGGISTEARRLYTETLESQQEAEEPSPVLAAGLNSKRGKSHRHFK